MTQPTPTHCPYLGLADDRTVSRTQPDAGHRCYAQTPPGSPDLAHQAAFCLAAAHPSCPFYVQPSAPGLQSSTPGLHVQPPRPRFLAWVRYLPWAVLAILLVAVALVYGNDLLRPAPNVRPLTPSPRALVFSPQPPTPTSTPNPQSPTPSSRLPTPTLTLEPRGQLLTLAPRAGDAGWWASMEARGNHLGDSFLYAGYLSGQAFVSAARFDLSRVPRGAPIRAATLRLTGLNTDRFRAEAGGTWQVQLLAEGAVKDYARADFQMLYNAPASATLFPALAAADLGVNRTQELQLDTSTRAWLAAQLVDGATAVIARITGPSSGDTVFAWDSGAGPASGGNPPQLALVLGAPPATPPPLPTEAVIVATYTPTPMNVLTVAADQLTATRQAQAGVTPLALRIVTPTPSPANLATVQVMRLAQGLPPVVIYTPTPANAATAAADAAYATAVAVTTGTFTPVPTHAVTPVLVQPTPVPGNIATAVAQLLEATRQADQVGTATPLPFNVIVATVTPSPYVVTNTPVPANYGTVVAQAVYATAVAFATGTFTPLPPNAMTATPLALLVYEDQMTPPRPSVTPTATPPAAMASLLVGKILFWTDRDGGPAVYALDVASGRVALVRQGDSYFTLAVQSEPFSPDGRLRAFVRNAGTEVRDNVTGIMSRVNSPQIFVEDQEYHTERQLTSGRSWSYDPAWSPSGERIVFVSTEPGNDEIFTIAPDGSGMQRLTFNQWEWDKHPTWSPDGQQIVFYSNRDTGRRQLWIMNADGSDQRRLLDSLYNDWDPVWVK